MVVSLGGAEKLVVAQTSGHRRRLTCRRIAVDRWGAHGVEGEPVCGGRWLVDGQVLVEEMADGAGARGGVLACDLPRGQEHGARTMNVARCRRQMATAGAVMSVGTAAW
jgi:hypothetical protein